LSETSPAQVRKPRKTRAQPPKTGAAPADPPPFAEPGPIEPDLTPALHVAELVHVTHGRVRLRVPAARYNPALLTEIRMAFEGHVGIDKVEVKAASSSIVIYYDDDHHADIGALFTSLGKTDAPAAMPKMKGPHTHHGHHRPPKTELDEKLTAFEEEAEFLAEHSNVARNIVESVKSLDRLIKRGTNNNLDLKILAPVGLAGFTFFEIGAAAATPMWVTLVIFSLNHFVELRAHTAEDDDGDTEPEPEPAS
jgi:hypothetical protein